MLDREREEEVVVKSLVVLCGLHLGTDFLGPIWKIRDTKDNYHQNQISIRWTRMKITQECMILHTLNANPKIHEHNQETYANPRIIPPNNKT